MPDTPASLAERMHDEGEKTLRFFRLLNPQDWSRAVYTSEETEPILASLTSGGSSQEVESRDAASINIQPSSWSLHDLLAHFVSAEASFTLLIQNILNGGSGAPEDFDIDRYNLSQVTRLSGASPEALMEEFESCRHRNVGLVAIMHPDDLYRKGRHPFLGIVPLADIIKLIYRHNAIHLRDVRKIFV